MISSSDVVAVVACILGSAGLWNLINNELERRGKKKDCLQEIKDEISTVKTEIKDVKTEIQETKTCLQEGLHEKFAILARTHILRFDDQLLNEPNRVISKEHFNQQLEDINTYLSYCDTHPNFKNECATAAIAHIRSTYQKYLENNLFN